VSLGAKKWKLEISFEVQLVAASSVKVVWLGIACKNVTNSRMAMTNIVQVSLVLEPDHQWLFKHLDRTDQGIEQGCNIA
jgi:hypothetical protein